MINMNNKFNGYKPKLGMIHVYDPARGDRGRPDQANTPPSGALVIPRFATEHNGQTLVMFEWIIEDPNCPGVEFQVDYCVVECLYPVSEYLAIGTGESMSRSEVARYNFSKFVTQAAQDQMDEERLPRSAGAILLDGVELLNERGEGYDNGQERSAARVAAMFSALKRREFTAMDVWDLLMCLKLVRAQNTTKIDSRADLTCYAALSAEEMEGIIYGSGPSEVDGKGEGWKIYHSGLVNLGGEVMSFNFTPKREF